MADVKHTPGPWVYRPDRYDDWGIVRASVTEQGQFTGGIICQAYDPQARDSITLARHREAGTDPWEANARLIAAAPTLLEALEGIVSGLADQDEEGLIEHAPEMEAARKAIALAKGEKVDG